MAMRVGEMMVIIRAQDFASRTLRRVGGEFAHLSREQQKAFRKQALEWQKYDAKASQLAANEMQRQLNLAKKYRATTQALDQNTRKREKLLDRLGSAERRAAQLSRATTTFGPAGVVNPQMVQAATRARSAVRGLKEEIVALDKAAEPINTRMNRLGSVLSRYPGWVRQAATSGVGWRSGLSKVNTELETAHRNLERAKQAELAWEQAVKRMPVNRIQDVGHALSGVGRTMQLFGAVSTVAFGAAANSAANFSTQISLAATQARDLTAPADQVTERIDQMTNGFEKAGVPVEGILDLMERFPATQEEMAASAYDIFSSMDLMHNGITDVAAGLDLLDTANKIAVAGGEDLDIATQAMITTFNNFDPQLKNTTETLDTMFDIIRFGRMRLSDFNTMMNKIAPAAQGANQTLRDVGGAMAFLTEVMPSQRMVATGISRLLEALNHPDIVKGLKEFGINVRKVEGGLRPLDAIMNDLAKTFPKLTTGQLSMAEFFKVVSSVGRGGGQGVMFTAEGRKAATQILTHMEQFNERQQQIDQNKGEFAKANAAQMKALGIQWDIFMNRVRAVVLAIGMDAIPVFQELGQGLKKLLDWWQSMDDETRKSIVRFAVYASVATLLGGVLLALVGAGMGVAAMFMRMRMGLAGIEGKGAKAWAFLKKMKTAVAFLGAIGTIALIVDVSRSGDASAWNLLMGAMSGAAAGSAFGPWGALGGAIVVPVVLQLIDDFTKPKRPPSAMRRAWQDYINGALKPGETAGMTFEQFRDAWNKKFNKRNFKIPKGITAVEEHRSETSGQEAKKLTGAALAQQKYNEALMQHAKKMQTWRKNMKEWREDMKRHAEEMADYNQQLANAIVQANQEIIDASRNMFMELDAINKQLMGEVFQGPLYSGESGDLMREWGIFGNAQTMLDDARAANKLFKQVQTGLSKLRKLGAPIEAIEAIQRMDPKDARGFIEGILRSKPAVRKALFAQIKQNEKDRKSQTKLDFTDEIERFQKAGLDMGEAIKNGFEEAAVGKWFDNWVKKKFPAVIDQAVNAAVATWKAQNPPPVAPVKPVRPTKPVKPGELQQVSNPAGFIKQENSNNTTTTYINVSMSGKGVNSAEQERLFGFIIRQSVNGKLRVGTIPNRTDKGRPGGRGD